MLGELIFTLDRVWGCQHEHNGICHMLSLEAPLWPYCCEIMWTSRWHTSPRVVFSRMNATCCWNCPVGLLLFFLVETSTKYLNLHCSGCQDLPRASSYSQCVIRQHASEFQDLFLVLFISDEVSLCRPSCPTWLSWQGWPQTCWDTSPECSSVKAGFPPCQGLEPQSPTR